MAYSFRKWFPGFLLLLVASTPLFAQAPIVSGLTPAAGPVGTSVVIQGSNFSPTAANNAVYFGAVRAVVSSVSATQLQVTVPAGATSIAAVTVTNTLAQLSSASVTAASQFTVTFPGGVVNSSSYLRNDYAVGMCPRGIVAADWKTDLATANIDANTVTILTRNAANNGFDPTTLMAGTRPYYMVTGDFNGDGKADLTCLSNNIFPSGCVERITSVLTRKPLWRVLHSPKPWRCEIWTEMEPPN
jgi:hypothetical protein